MSIDKEIPLIYKPEEGEELLHTLHRKFLSFLGSYIFGILIFVLIILGNSVQYIIRYISGNSELFSYGLIAISMIVAIIIIIGSIIGIFYVHGHLYLITNQRFIIYKKFIVKQLREVRYEKIKDVILLQGPFGRIFNYGSVIPTTAGIELGGVRRNIVSYFASINGVENPNTIRKHIAQLADSIQLAR